MYYRPSARSRSRHRAWATDFRICVGGLILQIVQCAQSILARGEWFAWFTRLNHLNHVNLTGMHTRILQNAFCLQSADQL
jgi:hypothetical protein